MAERKLALEFDWLCNASLPFSCGKLMKFYPVLSYVNGLFVCSGIKQIINKYSFVLVILTLQYQYSEMYLSGYSFL